MNLKDGLAKMNVSCCAMKNRDLVFGFEQSRGQVSPNKPGAA